MTPARCAILGMDAQTAYTYEYFFRKFGEGRYTQAPDEPSANVLLVDIDTPEGRRLAQPYLTRHDAERLLIVVSANNAHPDHVLLLQKPVTSMSLREVLDKAVQRLRHQPPPAPAPAPAPAVAAHHGHARDVQGVATAALAMEEDDFNHYMFRFDAGNGGGSDKDLYFEPDQHLYGALVKAWRLAVERQCMVELRWELPSIRICPVERHIATGMTDKVMRSVAVTHTHTQLLPLEGDLACWPPGAQTEPIENVLWRLAAWTSRGRLPQGTHPEARVRLKRWPNMTRLLPTPHAMQIAALWTSGAYTLAETAKRLMTSQGDVHVFYCAAHALGLLEINQPLAAGGPATPPDAPATPANAPADTPSKSRGLLSRILGRLLSR